MSTTGSEANEDTEDEWNWLCTDDPCTRPLFLTFVVADASCVYWEEGTNNTVFCVHGHAFSVPAEPGQNNLDYCLGQWYRSRFGDDIVEKSTLIEIRAFDGTLCVHLAVPDLVGGNESDMDD